MRAEFTRPIHRQRRGRMEGGDPNPARVDGKIFTRKKYVLISERSEFNEMIMKRRMGGRITYSPTPLHSAPPRTKMEKVCYRVNKSGRGKRKGSEIGLDRLRSVRTNSEEPDDRICRSGMNEIGEACPSITTPIAIVSEDGKEGWGRWMRIADYERYLASEC